MKIKSLVFAAVLATAILCFGGQVKALTIQDLQAQIAQLMAQLQAMQNQQGQGQTWCHTFNRNIGVGDVAKTSDTGDEVYDLQTALQKEGFPGAKEDNVNSGSGGMIFGENTAAAVVKLQQKYGIIQTGFVGPITRTKLNSLYGCGNPNPNPGCQAGAVYNSLTGALCSPTPPTSGSAIVISPTAGTTWTQGQTNTISWTTGNTSSISFAVNLIAVNGSGSSGTIAEGGANIGTNSASWDAKTICNSWTGSVGSNCSSINPGSYEIQIVTYVMGTTTPMTISSSPFTIVAPTPTLPAGCTSTSGYSTITGQSCGTNTTPILPPGCTSTAGFSSTTGQSCNGCISTSGFSPTTGASCNIVVTPTCQNLYWHDSNSTSCGYKQFCGAYTYNGLKTFNTLEICQVDLNPSVPYGCTSTAGFSSTTGVPCNSTTQPSITVTSPNGGETWIQGKTYNITWTSAGLLADATVNIALDNFINGSTNYAIASALASQGTYSWVVPATLSGNNIIGTKLKVVISYGNLPDTKFAVSANYFSIASSNIDFNGDGVVNSADLAIFSACLNVPMTDACRVADLNEDGNVDFADLWVFRQFYPS